MGKKPTDTPNLPVNADGVCVLEGTLFWKWRAYDAEVQVLTGRLNDVAAQINTEIAKNPTLAALLNDRQSLTSALSQKKAAHGEVLQEIAKVYNIQTTGFAIDDNTGRIFLLDDEGNEIALQPPAAPPVASPKKKRRP